MKTRRLCYIGILLMTLMSLVACRKDASVPVGIIYNEGAGIGYPSGDLPEGSCYIMVFASPANGGKVNGGGDFNAGESCTVTAVANSGYTFTNWTVDGNEVSKDASYTFTVTTDQNLVANFVAKPAPTGAIQGLFSIGASKQIYFSKGNLQYQASTSTWRFAERQYDYLAEENLNISSTYSGWIDLFGWGTSGYNHRYPYNAWYNDSYGNPNGNLDNTSYDWGRYNAISNGGNEEGKWRTLNKSEVYYLFNSRSEASQLYSKASVAGKHGLIVLPDNWEQPSGLTFSPKQDGWWTNTYTEAEWQLMEDAGAVFLPAAGGRCFKYYTDSGVLSGGDIRNPGTDGYYWTSTAEWYEGTISSAHIFNFNETYYSLTGNNYGSIAWAWSVRLVQDI